MDMKPFGYGNTCHTTWGRNTVKVGIEKGE